MRRLSMLSFGIGSAARNSASCPCSTSYILVQALVLLVSKHWPRQLPIATAQTCFNTMYYRGFYPVFDLGGPGAAETEGLKPRS